jgi:hypothetical protein
MSRKQEQAIAALLQEPTLEAAAARAGIGVNTLARWLREPPFAAEYRAARRRVVEGAIGRVQGATGAAVDTLVEVTKSGKKDADRVRAAATLLDHALRGVEMADVLHRDMETDNGDASPMGTTDLVRVLAAQLRQLDGAELSTAEKARLTATLADALLRAIGVDVIDRRLEALSAVLGGRKDGKER